MTVHPKIEPTADDTLLMQRVLIAAAEQSALIPPAFMESLVDFLSVRGQTQLSNVLGFKSQQLVRGQVDSTGAVVGGVGFTASKTATGTYQVTFGNPFAAVPCINVSVDSSSSLNAVVVSKAVDNFVVKVFTSNTAAATDSGFEFLAAPFLT